MWRTERRIERCRDRGSAPVRRAKKAADEREEIVRSVHDVAKEFLATRNAEDAQKDLWSMDIVMNDDCPSRIESPYFIDAHGQIDGFGRQECTRWIVQLDHDIWNIRYALSCN